MKQPQKNLELEFTILEFYPTYVVSSPREGAILDQKQLADLVEACSDHYSGKNFVFISSRENDFNVNPTIYIDVEEVKNLAGIAVVAKKESSIEMANFEKNICKVPYEIFRNMEEALAWADKMVENKNEKADL